jgi:hypothetical protein
MKHAVIITDSEKNNYEKCIEVEASDGQKLFLAEQEYTQAQTDEFNKEKSKWIISRARTRYFLADSDSGEDARGYYCGYFDLLPENAVFKDEKLAGCYLCAGSFNYSGRGRASFEVEKWGYPGDNPFVFVSCGNKTHVFIFSDEATHSFEDWELLVRNPQKEYRSYIDF